MMRRLPVPNRNAQVRREHDHLALRRLLFWVAGGVLLAGGFLFAAWQHVTATRYGYEFEKLRQERKQLEADQMYLHAAHEREISLPAVDSRAAAAGLKSLQASQMGVIKNDGKPVARPAQEPDAKVRRN